MGVLDFLGQLGSAAPQSGGTFALDPEMMQREMAINNLAEPRQAPMPQQPQKRGGVRHFLGILGDALLSGAGAEPIYGPTIEREEMGNALAQYVGNTDQALADIMRRDPATGLALLKMKQDAMPDGGEGFTLSQGQIRYGPNGQVLAQAPGRDPANDPTFIRELEMLGIDPRSPQALELYYGRNSPAGYLLRPPSGGASPEGLPRVASPEEARQLPPGSKFIMPDGRVGTVPGGGAGNGAGGFPGR